MNSSTMTLCSIVLFAVLVAFVSADGREGEEGMRELLGRCATENELDLEKVIKNLHNADPEIRMKCVFECMCRKAGLMLLNGTVDQAGLDRIIADMPEKLKAVNAILKECVKLMKPRLPMCQAGWLVGKCVVDKMTEVKLIRK